MVLIKKKKKANDMRNNGLALTVSVSAAISRVQEAPEDFRLSERTQRSSSPCVLPVEGYSGAL